MTRHAWACLLCGHVAPGAVAVIRHRDRSGHNGRAAGPRLVWLPDAARRPVVSRRTPA